MKDEDMFVVTNKNLGGCMTFESKGRGALDEAIWENVHSSPIMYVFNSGPCFNK